MRTTHIEVDPEGLGPDLAITSDLADHKGHEVEATETLFDNPIEMTQWGHCRTCDVEVMIHSQTWADFDAWLAKDKEKK